MLYSNLQRALQTSDKSKTKNNYIIMTTMYSWILCAIETNYNYMHFSCIYFTANGTPNSSRRRLKTGNKFTTDGK